MNCPACSEALPPGQDRCPSCGASVAPPVDGALAPRLVTPPARAKLEPERSLPGARKREPTWKDEVRERMRDRKRGRVPEAELPLFAEADVLPEPAAPDADPAGERVLDTTAPTEPALAAAPRLVARREDEPSLDLPLRFDDPAVPLPERSLRVVPDPVDRAADPGRPEAPPVERPAYLQERVQAAAIDVVLFASAALLVVYFAGRAARQPLLGLLPAWPWIAGFVACLGLAYAAWFTGLRGQTPGKMLVGLMVVDSVGDPRLGHPRALLRALLGSLGVAAAGLGILPVFFDPARRALHDRLFRTRVIRI